MQPSNWTSCTRTLRSRRDIENVDKQLVQLVVLVSMLPTMPGILKLVRYLQQGPRSTKRAPSTAIEFQRARLRVGKTAFTSTTMWRMFAARTGGPRALASLKHMRLKISLTPRSSVRLRPFKVVEHTKKWVKCNKKSSYL